MHNYTSSFYVTTAVWSLVNPALPYNVVVHTTIRHILLPPPGFYWAVAVADSNSKYLIVSSPLKFMIILVEDGGDRVPY